MIAQVQEKCCPVLPDPKTIHDAGYRDALGSQFNWQFSANPDYRRGYRRGYCARWYASKARWQMPCNLPETPIFTACTDGADDLHGLMPT